MKKCPSSRRRILRKRVIFVGCEGESEQAYVALLNEMLKELNLPIHLRAELLNPGAGDPLELVKKARERIRKQGRDFAGKAIFLDRDRCAQDRKKGQKAQELAEKEQILLVWQDPCHEGFLLRHLDGCENQTPGSSEKALQALWKKWPDYQKPRTRSDLQKRIDRNAVERAGKGAPCFREFLEKIGWSSR